MLLVLGMNSQKKRAVLKVSVSTRTELYKLNRGFKGGEEIKTERKRNVKRKKSNLLSNLRFVEEIR